MIRITDIRPARRTVPSRRPNASIIRRGSFVPPGRRETHPNHLVGYFLFVRAATVLDLAAALRRLASTWPADASRLLVIAEIDDVTPTASELRRLYRAADRAARLGVLLADIEGDQ